MAAVPTLTRIAEIAKEAGTLVASMQQEIHDRQEFDLKPGDNTPVTKADRLSNALIIRELTKAYSGIPIVSEENRKEDNATALLSRERFYVDPLDNTHSYIENYDGYSVNIGRVKDGVPVAGAIYFPGKRELYFTGEDHKAYLQIGDGTPQQIQVEKVKLPLRRPLKVAVGWNEQNLSHVASYPVKTEKLPGQYRTCSVAKGNIDITGVNSGYNGGFESWDLAAAHAVLKAAGGEIVTAPGPGGGVPIIYREDTTKIPAHTAGGTATLIALGLMQKQRGAEFMKS